MLRIKDKQVSNSAVAMLCNLAPCMGHSTADMGREPYSLLLNVAPMTARSPAETINMVASSGTGFVVLDHGSKSTTPHSDDSLSS